MDNIFIRFLLPQIVFLILIINNSCSLNKDYYNSDEYKIKQRQEESLDMFKKTHKVRKKCSKKYNYKVKRKKRYYS